MKEFALGKKTFSINRKTDHSFEFVACINDVTFINDSKATNAKQTVESINSVDTEIVLILGGDDLKTDYSWFKNINEGIITECCKVQSNYFDFENEFQSNKLKKGPCEHILASRMMLQNNTVKVAPN